MLNGVTQKFAIGTNTDASRDLCVALHCAGAAKRILNMRLFAAFNKLQENVVAKRWAMHGPGWQQRVTGGKGVGADTQECP